MRVRSFIKRPLNTRYVLVTYSFSIVWQCISVTSISSWWHFSLLLFTATTATPILMVICSIVSEAKLWEIIFEGNFSFCSQHMTRNWTFDKLNLFITSEASFKEGSMRHFMQKIDIKELEINRTSLNMCKKLLRSSFWQSWKVFVKENWANIDDSTDRCLQRPLLSAFGEFAQLYLFGQKSVIFPWKTLNEVS